MKKLFALLMLFTSILAMAQVKNIKSSFHINGTVSDLQHGTALLQYEINGTQKTLTSTIKNGSFSFDGYLSDPQQVTINFSNNNYNGSISFFAENHEINIIIDTADLLNASIKGSATQKEFETYNQEVASIEKRSADLNETGKQLFLSGKITEHIKDSLFKIHFDLENEKYNIIEAFIKDYPASAVSAWAIITNLAYDPKPEILEPLFNTLTASNQISLYGKQIRETIEITKKTAIGKPAINITENDATGKAVSLSSFKGKYVLVDFWASWCGPCRAENPNIVKMYNEYKDKGFNILGVSLDSDKDAWLQAIKADHLAWTEVSDLDAWKNSAAIAYRIKGIPFNLLLDKNGIIIAINLRGIDLENKLKEVLN